MNGFNAITRGRAYGDGLSLVTNGRLGIITFLQIIKTEILKFKTNIFKMLSFSTKLKRVVDA
jgi:hypothetical protein